MTGPVATPLPMNHTSSNSISTKTSSSGAQHCSRSDSTGDDSYLNDDSNPQQGTPSHRQGVGPPAPRPGPSAPLEGAGEVTLAPNATLGAPPLTTAGAATTARPHPSRQNSGSRDSITSSSKFPPTVKDIRKLFVGGLPSDGTSILDPPRFELTET
jgi:hypothetical protein